jgi:hypothetical protein
MAKQTKPRVRTRHSIGEWYGRGFEIMSPVERQGQARQEVRKKGAPTKQCPFQENAKCNKRGGVCSLRLYEQIGRGAVAGTGSPIATCPNRFMEDSTIYRWVGETLLGTSTPIVLSEIGFLDRVRPSNQNEDEEGSADFIGRIDNVLLHPDRKPLDWCALEIQAVYFSGKAMKQEFSMLAKHKTDTLPFPAAHRRPDWRSSGPKRLLPQLQTKTPTIRTWGKKMAVVIDEPFFGSLVDLDREKHPSNAEIAWFVVGYEPTTAGWKLTPREVVYTKLEASVKALTGGIPLSKEAFENQLVSKLLASNPGHPLSTGGR